MSGYIPDTLVYPLSEQAAWDHGELRYSIRSFCKYLHIARVIVVGYKPSWYTGEHLPFADGKRKERNIFEKVCEAAKHTDCFIFANDDHFMLRPDPIDYYYSRPLFAKVSDDWYGKQCKNTYDIFPNGMFFDIHTPMIIESALIPRCYDWSKEYVFKSIYCNHNNITGVQMADCKIPGYMNYDRITEYCANRSFMSLGTGALSKDMKRWLQDRYPDPSPFEFGDVEQMS